MPFASFKNIQKRNARLHKERSQPSFRARLGALPKKKDFVLRARDSEAKRNKIIELKRKALTKNEDEFYFAMHNSAFSPERGHIPLSNEKEYSEGDLKGMISRDLCYLRQELTIEMKKIRDLEARFNLLQADPTVTNKRLKPKQTIFAQSVEEARAIRASFQESVITTQIPGNVEPNVAEEIMNLRAAGYKELSERIKRADLLKLAIRKREAKDRLMKHSHLKHKVVRKGNKNHAPLYKFERRRQ
nr:sodium bile acid cotransporter [Hymenolepis microstoma]